LKHAAPFDPFGGGIENGSGSIFDLVQ